MLVLGIESASDQCGCALATDSGIIAEARLALPRRHAEALAPQMRFVCEQAGVALGDVDVVAVDCGPGLYTGLRAGIATAKAAAAALGVGVVPVGSLEALAFGARPRPGETVLSVLDARRGEVFWAWYRCVDVPPASPAAAPSDTTRPGGASAAGRVPSPAGGSDLHPPSGVAGAGGHPGGFADPSVGDAGGLVSLTVPRVGPPEALVAELIGSPPTPAPPEGEVATPANIPPPGEPPQPALVATGVSGDILVVGDGALRYADVLAVSPRVVMAGPELRFPLPGAVALLGRERALAGGTIPPEQVEALYLRPPDSRPQP